MRKKQPVPPHEPGYWLVRASDKSRFYISKEVDSEALDHVADRVLSDKNGWDYWIDYSHGLDVTGRIAWSNLDHSDAFYEVSMAGYI